MQPCLQIICFLSLLRTGAYSVQPSTMTLALKSLFLAHLQENISSQKSVDFESGYLQYYESYWSQTLCNGNFKMSCLIITCKNVNWWLFFREIQFKYFTIFLFLFLSITFYFKVIGSIFSGILSAKISLYFHSQ